MLYHVPVVYVGVFVYQDVPEADGTGYRLGRGERKNLLSAQASDGLRVALRDGPTLGDDDMVRDSGAAFNGGDEEVFHGRECGFVREQLRTA